MPSCAQSLAGEEQPVKTLPFCSQVFAIILTPRFQAWQNLKLCGIFGGPKCKASSNFSLSFVRSPHSSQQRERGGITSFLTLQKQTSITFSTETALSLQTLWASLLPLPSRAVHLVPREAEGEWWQSPRGPTGLSAAPLPAVLCEGERR